MTDFESRLPLGKATQYLAEYDAALLCPFPRQLKRDEIGVKGPLPFQGEDIWNGYEISWLNLRGKPQVAMGEFRFSCNSHSLIESKSFKLYLNSFNQTKFSSTEHVEETMRRDLGAACGAEVFVALRPLSSASSCVFAELPGRCIDDLDIEVSSYDLCSTLLAGAAAPELVEEELHSHLLKSNCLVTNQPDWGSVLVRYRGGKIDPEALLRYLISFREHNEFHEQCVERIFVDLMRHCRPEKLSVYARYTRRGGLDINPFRSNFEQSIANWRLARQ